MGTAASSAGAAEPSEGLRAGRSSGLAKPEYTAASGRRDHATVGSWPTRTSDERDSEPDYLLRPTRHGPGGTLLEYIAFLFKVQVTEYTAGTIRGFKGDSFNGIFSASRLYFELAIKTQQAQAC